MREKREKRTERRARERERKRTCAIFVYTNALPVPKLTQVLT